MVLKVYRYLCKVELYREILSIGEMMLLGVSSSVGGAGAGAGAVLACLPDCRSTFYIYYVG